jgi:hypothetical protein
MEVSVMPGSRWSLEAYVFTLLVVIHLLPVWSFRYFPTDDGPSHVYNATVLHDYFNYDYSIMRKYYTINYSPVPNWFSHIALAGLMYFIPTIIAEKILVSSYIILLPLSFRYSLSSINQTTTFLSLLAFPFIHNHWLQRGFYNYVFSIAISIFILGYWLRHRNDFGLREILCLAGLALLLYFCHIVSLIVLVITIFILAISFTISGFNQNFTNEKSELKNALGTFRNPQLISLLGLLPALFLAGIFLYQHGSHISYKEYSWVIIVWPLYGIFSLTNRPENLLLSMGVVGLLIVVLYHSIARRTVQRTITPWDGLLLAAAILCILYLVAPPSMSKGQFINMRLMPFILLLLILWFGAQDFSKRAKFGIGTAGISLAVLLVLFNMTVYARLNKDVDEYLSGTNIIEPKSTLLSLNFAKGGCALDRGTDYLRASLLDHLSEYISAQQHVVSLSNYEANTGYFPILYRNPLNPFLHLSGLIEGDPEGGDLIDYTRQTGAHIDYVLLWCIWESQRDHYSRFPFFPTARKLPADTAILFKRLSAEYDLVFTSPQRGVLQIYRRKDFGSCGASVH